MARQLLEDEYARWGVELDEAELMRMGFSDMHLDRNAQELELADVVMVSAPLVAKTLTDRGTPPDRIHLAPYGVGTSAFPEHHTTRRDGEPLQLVFVGSQGLLKGVPYLLEALAKLGPGAAHLHAFGDLQLPQRMLKPYRALMTEHGYVTRDVLKRHLQRCHGTVLPSLWEGFGLVVYECLSSGLPMIVIRNVAATVQDGVEGFVVPIRDSDALAEAILELRDETKRRHMARAAAEGARNRNWEHYRRALVETMGIGGEAATS